MKLARALAITVTGMWLSLSATAWSAPVKTKIFVVSSYHREYLWEQQNNEGFCAAMLDFKFLDNKQQAEEYTRNDYVETDKIVLKKSWMDSKRKNSKEDLHQSTAQIITQMKEFKPDLIILGDDNAANFIGNYYVDAAIPVIFRGIVGSPAKYLLVDSIDHPGHNITGVLKWGHPKENIEYLARLVPGIKTFAILGDASETSKDKAGEIIKFQRTGKSPLELVDTILTNSYADWQDSALKTQDHVDAFFVLNHNTLRNTKGVVEPFEAMAWYLRNIKKPECVGEKQFVQEGALITVDDSAFKQSYEAVRMAHLVIHEKKNPADTSCVIPHRGKIVVNRQRAAQLGVNVTNRDFIEEFLERSAAIEKYPQ